jgi:predicted molibdopterin-dependent oxidoreductase YjgC
MQRMPYVSGLTAVQKGTAIKIIVNGKGIDVNEGDTIAAALLSAGIRSFRLSPKLSEPRSLYCGMGICFECLVTVDGVHAVRACVTPVADGMRVETCKEMEL